MTRTLIALTLVTLLVISVGSAFASQAGQSRPSGNYTFSLVQFRVKEGVNIKPSQLGTLISLQVGQFRLNTGGTESGVLEWYDSNGDRYPDFVITRRNTGQIISIGLDYGTTEYNRLLKLLGTRVVLWNPTKQNTK